MKLGIWVNFVLRVTRKKGKRKKEKLGKEIIIMSKMNRNQTK